MATDSIITSINDALPLGIMPSIIEMLLSD
jgi:hypothetical protein